MSESQQTTHFSKLLTERMQSYVMKALQTIQLSYKDTIRNWLNRHTVQSFVSLFLVGAFLSITVASCSGSSSASKNDVKLKLVSFSVTKAAHDQIIPKFVEKWKQEHNQSVTFEQSYGGSVAQAAAVIAGSQEADIVHLALPLDVSKIQQAGLIKSGWETKAPRSGIVSRSVAAIVTREGNPKGINTWADLAKDGVKVIAANPKTSGIAIWEFLAFWGSVTLNGGDEATALDYVTKVYKNTPILTKDAREASDLFFQKNQGDVLINYENEVILAGKNGNKLPYIVPKVNISIDNPVAIVDKNVEKHGTREVAQAFVDFLYSTEAQREFAKLQYRPVNPTVTQEVASQYQPIETLFTSQDLGGWDIIQKKFFGDGAIFDKVQAASKA
ncbi:sulfate ABC transporter substrate-binding protein [Nostoc sp. ATCC 53789]|uniref:sulfate ABC transporter substrate-binding protein n=1 Tax=Nostoc sp. ATCC 53789 TaxID=76335 RepID=UPI000DECEF7A|nr:sulfate ABC transporter substrate-binding protein [Nostoc sp. ATCC 53789]MBD2509910.1 sulfate ABC transporter substrate-binding protein [Desmonostoc muscorum FACHB-395]QHG17088.1 sulfate ABC transporter substrate-binding protein [Nostoc sp. ATCC 53789]RCJ15570.1 sulfate-binding protein [Nostoc sp. ATCC 53789]